MKRGLAIFLVVLTILMSVSAAAAQRQVYDAGYATRGAVSITGGVAVDTDGRGIAGAPSLGAITGMATVRRGCEATNLPSYREYGIPSVRQTWDRYSADSDGVCRFDLPNRPSTGDCKYTVELNNPTVGTYGYMCWYETGTGAPDVASQRPTSTTAPGGPAGCTTTHLPSYQQYRTAKATWDRYSAETLGVCRFDNPLRPKSGDCVHQVQLSNAAQGQVGTLCWYGSRTNVGGPTVDNRPDPFDTMTFPPLPAQRQRGFFGWLRGLFGGGQAPGVDFPYTAAEAEQIFMDEVFSQSELPEGAMAFMFPQALPAGTIISDGIWTRATIGEPFYIAWLDPAPELMYGHGTYYMFLYQDGMVEVLEGNGWAKVNNHDLSKVGRKIWPRGNSPTGAFVASARAQSAPSYGRTRERRPAMRTLTHPKITQIPAPTAKPEQEAQEECPPGYQKVEVEGEPEEEGASTAALGRDHPRPSGIQIDLAGEAGAFLTATKNAKFEASNPLTTPAAVGQALQKYADSMDKTSTFAMMISAHGLDVWDAVVTNPRNGRSVKLENFPGEPKIGKFGIPPGATISQKTHKGFCFGLGGKCVMFNPDIHLAPIKSCRKFLVSNSCYSGALTEHNVKGLSVYTAATKSQPAKTFPTAVAQGGRVPSYFGHLFMRTLLGAVPLDPTQPQKDEPKPEFDAAFAAASRVPEGRRIIIGTRSGQRFGYTVSQTPQQKSIPHEKNCASSFKCIPIGGIPPEGDSYVQPPPEMTCDDYTRQANAIPETLTRMMDQDTAYPYDRLEAVAGMIAMLEKMKDCAKCPPPKTAVWENCNPSRESLIDSVIQALRTFGQNRFQKRDVVPQINALLAEIAQCKLSCYDLTDHESVLDDLDLDNYIPGIGVVQPRQPDWTCPRGMVHTEKDCRRGCMMVPNAECVQHDRCWACQSKVRPTTGSLPQDEPIGSVGGGTPVETIPEPKEPKSCSEICSDRGMVTSMPDHSSYILNYLNSNGVCKKSAQVSFGSYLKSGSCTCYPSSPPSISVSGELRCDNTPCGPVDCNSEKTCSCGENCEMHVTCSWGGWKQVGQQAFTPTIKVST